jgi:hypothetical protein
VSRMRCWGVFRERAHSPGREVDDGEILRLTGKHLEERGFDVVLKSPDELSVPGETPPPFIFLMCEGASVLPQLRAWEATGVRLVNSLSAVLDTHRERMIARFAAAGVAFVPSAIVSTRTAAPPALPVWVKRADVHNTQDGDVVFADDEPTFRSALAGLAARGMGRAVVQAHVAGDLVKFYGIGRGAAAAGPHTRHSPSLPPSQASPQAPWFRWFYHKDQIVAGNPLDPARLAWLAGAAATALGLEVYGGDAIATPAGDLVLLDLNAWPSFALYRDEAGAAIAGYLAGELGGGEARR